jgi:UDP-N-acetylglucosamine acyltransferase
MIHPTSVIYPNVIIEKGSSVGPLCIIGAPPESKSFQGKESGFGVVIRSGAIIHGHATIDAGTVRNTEIKAGAYIMKGCHIGHDALIHEGATLAPHVVVGGHSEIGFNTNMGIASVVHQRCIVPEDCMIGMNATITKRTKLVPNGKYIGTPARWIGKNRE